jgi:hypothetical protein
MSAFMLSYAHLSALANTALDNRRDLTPDRYCSPDTWHVDAADGERLFIELARENVRSLAYRYPGDTGSEADALLTLDAEGLLTFARQHYNPNAHFPGYPNTGAQYIAGVLKQIACFEYQSCEHPAWEQSKAKLLCDHLRGRLISQLPGFEAAPWGITDEQAVTTVISLMSLVGTSRRVDISKGRKR